MGAEESSLKSKTWGIGVGASNVWLTRTSGILPLDVATSADKGVCRLEMCPVRALSAEFLPRV